MKKCIMMVSILVSGFLVSACGSTTDVLTTKISNFKATIATVDQTPPVTITAGKDVTLSWNVDTLATTYDANLYISSTTSPSTTPLYVKVGSSGSGTTTCTTSTATVLGVSKTVLTCTGLLNPYDVTALVGQKAYFVLKATGLNAASDTATIEVKL
jgi:hypothetical protein